MKNAFWNIALCIVQWCICLCSPAGGSLRSEPRDDRGDVLEPGARTAGSAERHARWRVQKCLGAEPSVATQLRGGYASLVATMQKPGATDADLGLAVRRDGQAPDGG